MRRYLSGFLLALSMLAAGFAPPAAAAPATGDAPALQAVVRAQLDAFAADDAKRAFSFATQSIQTLFGTPEQFLAMVRATYPVVYRPASVTFLQPRPDDKIMMQPVHMTDAEGRGWLAVYRLERQKDKTWRIAGCVLVPQQNGQTI